MCAFIHTQSLLHNKGKAFGKLSLGHFMPLNISAGTLMGMHQNKPHYKCMIIQL